MAQLDQDLESFAGGPLDRLDGAHRGAGGSGAVAEAIDHPEQSGVVTDGDRDFSVAAGVLAGYRATRVRPLDRP